MGNRLTLMMPLNLRGICRCDLADSAPDRDNPQPIKDTRGNMTVFRLILFALLALLSIYTAIVVMNHGFNFLPTAFDDMFAMTWQKQFNIDFMTFLVLSAIWTAWRHQFSPAGLGLGVLAFFGGMIFLAIYLLIVSFQVKGDVRALLLGKARALEFSGKP